MLLLLLLLRLRRVVNLKLFKVGMCTFNFVEKKNGRYRNNDRYRGNNNKVEDEIDKTDEIEEGNTSTDCGGCC